VRPELVASLVEQPNEDPVSTVVLQVDRRWSLIVPSDKQLDKPQLVSTKCYPRAILSHVETLRRASDDRFVRKGETTDGTVRVTPFAWQRHPASQIPTARLVPL
jgi:hypothetical protein